MKSKAKLAGHPAQPNLVVFQLGPLVASTIFDGVNLINGRSDMAPMSYWTMALGLIASFLVAIVAWTDWLANPAHTRAKRISLLHSVVSVVVLSLLIISWYWRKGEPGYQPPTLALLSSGLAFVLLSLAGWLADERIDRPGVFVDEIHT